MTLELGVAAPAGDLRVNTMYLGATTGGGLMNQTNGAVNITDYLYLGFEAGSGGTYNLTAGTLTSNNLVVGEFGRGTFDQSENTPIPTTVTITNDLAVGANAGGQGHYYLRGGDLFTNYTFVGHSGEGQFDHDGGQHTVTNALVLGYAAGSWGSYNFNGGTLNIGGNMTVGDAGEGDFDQSGGPPTSRIIFMWGPKPAVKVTITWMAALSPPTIW